MNQKIDAEEVRVHSDSRGVVFEPLNADQLKVQQNVHVAVSAPGCVRGNHFHRRANEILIAMGPVLVRLREDGKIRDVPVPQGAAYRFVLPAGVSHAVQNTGSGPSVLVSFSSIVHDPANPDVVADKLI
jgi:dTDP-4-dehydrorhamnose 3,5-epimerase-like enzyme